MDGALSYARSVTGLFRKIALMRNANDLIYEPKRSRDFGRGRQERNDAMHSQAYTLRGSQ
jgi:hypothetical protein